MNAVEKKFLVDDALAKIATDGEIAAMKWLADSIEAKYKEKLEKATEGIVTVVESTYKGTQFKCEFIDKDFGTFLYLPYHLLQGCAGHPKRKQLKS